MLIALSNSHKAGLFTVAAIFIAFSLASSFLFPRLNPAYPGRRLGLFVGAVAVLTIAMLGAVELFAVEEEHEAEAAAETTGATETTPTPSTTTAPAAPPAGDAAAGKAVFASAGCGACHALKAANASGKVGPDLDTALEGKDAAFIHESIVDPEAEIASGYPGGVMPANFGETLSEKQIDDLVALLSQ